MGVKSLVQVVAMIATMLFINGQLLDIVKRVQIAKIHLIKASKGSSWGIAMLP